jgi:hypothetical protein
MMDKSMDEIIEVLKECPICGSEKFTLIREIRYPEGLLRISRCDDCSVSFSSTRFSDEYLNFKYYKESYEEMFLNYEDYEAVYKKSFRSIEAVPQLLLAPKISLLFGFEALFAFLFLPILGCWTASIVDKIKKFGEMVRHWLWRRIFVRYCIEK